MNPGDRIAVQDPRYSSYDQAIGTAGGDIVPVPTGGDRPFQLAGDELRQHAEGCKLLVFVNPSNPTGACVGPEGVRDLARAAGDLRMVVLADEIYEDMVFREEPFLSLLAVDDARGRSVVLSGFSKAYAMTGFRVGYLVGPARLHRCGGGHQEHHIRRLSGVFPVHCAGRPRSRSRSASRIPGALPEAPWRAHGGVR